MATLWGLRLALHIGRRNHGRPEDYRYARLRERDGRRFWLTSLYRVYLVQAALMWVVALPLMAGSAHGAHSGLGGLDAVGVVVWAVGLAFEAVGDLQLARFRADPANGRRVMDGACGATRATPTTSATWSPGGGSASSPWARAIPGGRWRARRSTR